jgi:hypothetical protein
VAEQIRDITAMHSDRQLEGRGLAFVAAKEVLPFIAVY